MFVLRAAGLLFAAILTALAPLDAQDASATAIPLPEHPRPDLERARVAEPERTVGFRFDATNDGERAGWTRGTLPSPRKILVPFSWGSELSGVPDSADIGWYARSIPSPKNGGDAESISSSEPPTGARASGWTAPKWVSIRAATRPSRWSSRRTQSSATRSASCSAWTTVRIRSSSRGSRATAKRAGCGRRSISRRAAATRSRPCTSRRTWRARASVWTCGSPSRRRAT